MFLNALMVDNTYKSNKYRLSLLTIVGVMSIELIFAVGFEYCMECDRKKKLLGISEAEGIYSK
jgi:hypothetical protein